MNPAPTTTAVCAFEPAVRSRWASESERSCSACSPPATGSGAGVAPVASTRAVYEYRSPSMTAKLSSGVDSVQLDSLHEFDVAFGEPRPRMQRDIVGFAAQKVLAQRRAFVGKRGVRADEANGQRAVMRAECFGGADARRPTADDDQSGFGHRGRIPEGSSA